MTKQHGRQPHTRFDFFSASYAAASCRERNPSLLYSYSLVSRALSRASSRSLAVNISKDISLRADLGEARHTMLAYRSKYCAADLRISTSRRSSALTSSAQTLTYQYALVSLRAPTLLACRQNAEASCNALPLHTPLKTRSEDIKHCQLQLAVSWDVVWVDDHVLDGQLSLVIILLRTFNWGHAHNTHAYATHHIVVAALRVESSHVLTKRGGQGVGQR